MREQGAERKEGEKKKVDASTESRVWTMGSLQGKQSHDRRSIDYLK